MTLIKYYKTTTCYDGEREFVKGDGKASRHYPDEYLIGNILQKYQQRRFPYSDNITVLSEPWLNALNQLIRSGKKNTTKINELILQTIASAEKKIENTLILVPFLYGYHHPGMAIDVKNKTAIYTDPYGTKAGDPEVIALQKLLQEKGFKVLTVTIKQQTDTVSCGPILTASMIKFIEEFMAMGEISVNAFKAPRPNLATERLFQIYVNNTSFERAESSVDELMLADQQLWRSVFQEQNLPEDLARRVLEAVGEQKKFIESLPISWQGNSSQKLAVEFIQNFQSQITEWIFLTPEQLASHVEYLVDLSKQLFEQTNPVFDESLLVFFAKQDLFDEENIVQTHRMIGLKAYPKKLVKPIEDNSPAEEILQSSIIMNHEDSSELNPEQIDKKSHSAEKIDQGSKIMVFENEPEKNFLQIDDKFLSFEANKNTIQQNFLTKLKALKDKLDLVDEDDEKFKNAGTALYSILFSKQEEFFQRLTTDSTEDEIATKLSEFRKICSENVKVADKIMGHGWLYRTMEVLIKAVVGLFAGIGMVLGSIIGQGLVKAEHREKYANSFFTLNQTKQSEALKTFKEETLGDDEKNQGLLSSQNFKQ